MDVRVLLGMLATAGAFAAYLPYFRDLARGCTRPHAVSWLIWAILHGLGFLTQAHDGGGAGAWAAGATSLVCFVVFAIALRRGETTVTAFDRACLVAAAVALGWWSFTDLALLAVVLISAVEVVAFLPTFRKSLLRPHEETASTYAIAAATFVLALGAMGNLSLVTVVYPVTLVVANGAFVLLLIFLRRRTAEVPSPAGSSLVAVTPAIP